MTDPTDDDIAAIEARLADTTSAPWVHNGNGDVYSQRRGIADADDGLIYEAVALSPQTRIRDAELIAHAPADIAALLAEVRRLRRIEEAALAMEEAFRVFTDACDSNMGDDAGVAGYYAAHERYTRSHHALRAALDIDAVLAEDDDGR